MEPKEHRFAKREGLLIAAVLCLVLLLYLFQGMLYQAPAAAVEISIVGENSQKIVLETFCAAFQGLRMCRERGSLILLAAVEVVVRK